MSKPTDVLHELMNEWIKEMGSVIPNDLTPREQKMLIKGFIGGMIKASTGYSVDVQEAIDEIIKGPVQ